MLLVRPILEDEARPGGTPGPRTMRRRSVRDPRSFSLKAFRGPGGLPFAKGFEVVSGAPTEPLAGCGLLPGDDAGVPVGAEKYLRGTSPVTSLEDRYLLWHGSLHGGSRPMDIHENCEARANETMARVLPHRSHQRGVSDPGPCPPLASGLDYSRHAVVMSVAIFMASAGLRHG